MKADAGFLRQDCDDVRRVCSKFEILQLTKNIVGEDNVDYACYRMRRLGLAEAKIFKWLKQSHQSRISELRCPPTSRRTRVPTWLIFGGPVRSKLVCRPPSLSQPRRL